MTHRPAGSLYHVFRYTKLAGYTHASGSWLLYNERQLYNLLSSSKRLLVFDDEMADHCHQLYAPDEYFAELLTFTRTHSEWGAASQVRS